MRAEGNKQPTIEIIESSFEQTVSDAGKPKSDVKRGLQDALETQQAFTMASHEFLNRMGIVELKSDNGIMFMNGKLLEFSEEKVMYLYKLKTGVFKLIHLYSIALDSNVDAYFG